ncbi:hypothetical protein, conserved in Apicomplexan species [Plasmodium knowlesi strain H]|uniref:tRNA 4-demethylwyosine synthase (AdoMet-dependent) n=3 Tax=Plasmodium knowlesi TaxID=5850 RepID=A0A5K1VGU3_PLAKH|nr:uncharacterized protein PKNH_1007900 [Plasmodium knowlesi strain H]OTN67084.1 Uncharacterized protein PKNOH_S07445800 [Plasmodium knowlesi]CAA9988585.1 S-adenosyl-L-methionine-dependent tRNA 4-demethylwyosine synthase, putative [Plasmodium knowlesi strain H]SBO21400.1 hypothetical protein, conserved in Apicomplexan species [Plasmodium knowlesi strain H]SBO21854.1 hypothetical protein, conserved in Apicomplexan species [Plasmodium knowlesi strain H]VVS78059.1 S-adenosyl-L-methionine-dependen|eukprot:XP_002259561.1 [Plasmodium knowlesi strain H]
MVQGDDEKKRRNLLQTIFEQHAVRKRKKAKINLRIVYGSEGSNSYRKARGFLKELIQFFKDIENICNEVNRIVSEEGGSHPIFFNGRTNEVDHGENRLMRYFKEYSKLLQGKNEQTARTGKKDKFHTEGVINSVHEVLEEFQEKEKKCSDKFVNYLDCCISNNVCTVNFDFVNGNEFNDYSFFEHTTEYDLNVMVLFVSTASNGSFPRNCYKFEQLLEDLYNDFRVEKNFLKNIFYTCIGFGNKQYGSTHFCTPVKKCDKYLTSLGAQKLFKTLKLCDEENNEEVFLVWKCTLFKTISLGLLFYCFNFLHLGSFMPYADRKIYNSLQHYCFFFCGKAENRKGKKENIKMGTTHAASIQVPQEHGNQIHETVQKGESSQAGDPLTGIVPKGDPSTKVLCSTCGEGTSDRCTSDRCTNDGYTHLNGDEWEGMPTTEKSEDEMVEKSTHTYKKKEDLKISTSLCSSGEELEDLVPDKPKDMLTWNQRNKLTKEGYKIIGSHSAVKLCRWTKSHLRGRGGCYKHTFYGINSYQCMEATPSLACANKCVFCWRHHKNPVGTHWKWNKDDAEMIVDEALKKHKGMIKELKGAHGVIKERFDEAVNVRHCALSLVGEPIMYPDINKLIDELHSKNVSTFLVTNAQFPNELQKLHKVTQLYLSIDAPNEEALKNIDRPLFKDFWDRYIRCIKILKKRKERTVFRFTLVKEYNMMSEEILSYSKLIEYGYPDFIEIKAVTYCGSSDGYQLTMKNIPWHEEVYQFAYSLIHSNGYLPDVYEIACEHRHSCSILIAKKEFKINDKWHTWIDYEKFQFLVKQNKDFTALDYCAETPAWAVMGAEERGFNPCDERVYTKGKKKNKPPITENTSQS